MPVDLVLNNHKRIQNMSIEDMTDFIHSITKNCILSCCKRCPIYKVAGDCNKEGVKKYLESGVHC